VLIAAVVWVTLGLVVLISDSSREGHPGLDGIIGVVYFQVQLITSVGYGDVSPKTQERKIFMGVYVLAGNLIAGVGIADSLLRATCPGAPCLQGLQRFQPDALTLLAHLVGPRRLLIHRCLSRIRPWSSRGRLLGGIRCWLEYRRRCRLTAFGLGALYFGSLRGLAFYGPLWNTLAAGCWPSFRFALLYPR